MSYAERTRRIKIAREVEAMAIDTRDAAVLRAARECITAYGWMRRPAPWAWTLVSEFAA